MISVLEAQQRIISELKQLETISVPLDNALGRTLTRAVHSEMDLPSFDNSSVDGFALLAEDLASASSTNPISLDVIADVPAGTMSDIKLSTGQAARIMTGAPIPAGANAVIMVEDTDAISRPVGSSAPHNVTIFKSIKNGENTRRKASDIIIGQEILPAGINLRPQDIGMLAMLGVASVPVRRKPRVAIISSGDELLPVTARLEPGKIYDSNTYMLTSLAQVAGCEVIHIGVAADRYEAVEALLKTALVSKPDLIISSAGVSTGAFDYVKEVVVNSGSLSFWKVNMRPGKPLAFGKYQGIPFFGLPGNPVSAFVSFLVFVRPALEVLNGRDPAETKKKMVVLGEGIESDGRESYLRAVVSPENGRYKAILTGHQGSGNLFSLVQANALLIIPSGVKSCPPGSEVEAWILEN